MIKKRKGRNPPTTGILPVPPGRSPPIPVVLPWPGSSPPTTGILPVPSGRSPPVLSWPGRGGVENRLPTDEILSFLITSKNSTLQLFWK